VRERARREEEGGGEKEGGGGRGGERRNELTESRREEKESDKEILETPEAAGEEVHGEDEDGDTFDYTQEDWVRVQPVIQEAGRIGAREQWKGGVG
jgi:hypothetical protein